MMIKVGAKKFCNKEGQLDYLRWLKKCVCMFGYHMDTSACSQILETVTNTSSPLRISEVPADEPPCMSILFYNVMLIELRDMFRMIRGLEDRCEKKTIKVENITAFYDWFEGFFGIVTCMFEAEEDVVFSWIEKIGSVSLRYSLVEARRNANKKRAKDLCWDILDLKSRFDRRNADNRSTTSLSSPSLVTASRDWLRELADEAQQLTARILTYLHGCKEKLPGILNENFNFDERYMINSSLMRTLRASEPGKFLICAISRGFLDVEQRNGFLHENLRSSKFSTKSVPKQIRKFGALHTDVADRLATDRLIMDTHS